MEGEKVNSETKKTTCTEIWLVRHGETAWNKEGRIQGQLDVELNDIGREQARSLGKFLTTHKPNDHRKFASTIYSSDLQRAHETAKIISSQCATEYGFVDIVTDERLREMNFGELQGFTWAERGGSHSSITSKPEMRLHNGESYQDLQTRMEQAIEEIVWNNRGKRIVIASHGGSIRTYICATLGLTMRNMSRIVISNTSITKIKLHSCDVVANNSKKLKVLKREVACINWVPHDEE